MDKKRLYACIVFRKDEPAEDFLVSIAGKFSYSIESIEGGVLFDVSGLERLIGTPGQIAAAISKDLARYGIAAGLAVSESPDMAILLARRGIISAGGEGEARAFAGLPLEDLGLPDDVVRVLYELGIRNTGRLLAIPADEIAARFGAGAEPALRRIRRETVRLLTPNIRPRDASVAFTPESPVVDFGQLIFFVNHALEELFLDIGRRSLSSEQVDIELTLDGGLQRRYEIRASRPTLDRRFWLKLIRLRIDADPPAAAIRSAVVRAHFTRPRTVQQSLYAAKRPEPEDLLLTVGKLKKIAGAANVGIPQIVNDRSLRPFRLEPDLLPGEPAASGTGEASVSEDRLSAGFLYYSPPLAARVDVSGRNIVFVRTAEFAGRVVRWGGVWKSASHWWDKPWQSFEWDIEVAGCGVYRLGKFPEGWFVIGEYD